LAEGIAPATVTGEVMQIAGHSFPSALATARQRLIERVKQQGFSQVMEQTAYT